MLKIDNPSVNGLADFVRASLYRGLEIAGADPKITAIVIIGAGKVFSGGADIRQFNTPASTAYPMLRDVTRAIEESSKPVIAAIHGVALGGGLELALGCHFRIAAATSQLGLPEVQLGIVPGGGGTQRLPRLIGIERALDIIQSGKSISSSVAFDVGLVDLVIHDEDLEDAAVAFAERLDCTGGLPVVSSRFVDVKNLDFAERKKDVNLKAKNAVAQRAAIACVEASSLLPFEAGLDFERARFEELVQSSESKSLRHIFFAEREAVKTPSAMVTARTRDIKAVTVVGAGTMGVGITMSFANAGIPVTLVDRDQSCIERGLVLIRRNYDITASKGKLSSEEIRQRLAYITTAVSLDAAAESDLVIEAVFEDMAVKKELFGTLDRICKPGAILASNTSRLSIDEIAEGTSRRSDVIGLHFFSPANVMKLLEVVRSDTTSDEVIVSCMRAAKAIGKIPVLVRVCEGFVGNRMLTPYWREAGFLLEEGASPQQVDGALTRFGMAMGPLAMSDLAGLDINWATRKRLATTHPSELRYSKVADRICELGRFGQKTGAGYYRYEKGSRNPIPDPAIDELIADCAREAGITRRSVSDEEIVERCMLALINEGAKIVDEGIAQRASDVDVVYVNGYGFPAWRGGPMFYADTLGLDQVLEKLRALDQLQGAQWAPAKLIEELVASGKRLF